MIVRNLENVLVLSASGIPSLRISTAAGCNHRCAFCQVDGDFSSHRGQLERGWFHKVLTSIRNFHSAGVRHFSITGGEPLADPYSTFRVAETVQELIGMRGEREEGYFRLNTNGVHVVRNIENIGKYFDLVKISLHALDAELYSHMTNSKSSVKDFELVLEGISQLSHRLINIRVQMVLTKQNMHIFNDMIKFCESYSGICELKIFDVSEYKTLWHGLQPGFEYWEKQFAPIDHLIESAHQEWEFIENKYSIGGYGNPMPTFRLPSGLRIRFRSSSQGAFYSRKCAKCPALDWCSDGHCNLEVGPNCVIKVCRPQEGTAFDIGDEQAAIDLFSRAAFDANAPAAERVRNLKIA